MLSMPERVAVILPALNEEAAIGGAIQELARIARGSIELILLVDNGSTDQTAKVARSAGAEVIGEPRRGYGHACLAGIAALRDEITTVVFMDADGSDDPADLPRLLGPIERGEADMVLGSRVLGEREAGALTLQQRWGNAFATGLMRLLVGARYTDLGPFRAVRREALARLQMRDTNFGWTIEMQIKARRRGLRVLEIPVNYRRRRGGRSKVSGNPLAAVLAGGKILWTIFRYAL
jgi:glycosyltransferase involved in cell wall biosynthesis